MLSGSNLDIAEIYTKFKEKGIAVSFLVPTRTGLEKSIMDAHASLREYLKNNNIHDYSKQGQGPEHKVEIESILITGKEALKVKTSLYKPKAKQGDPRIWISSLNQHATAGDLIAVIKNNDQLLVVNCSKSNINSLIFATNSLLYKNLSLAGYQASNDALDLLDRIEQISKKGFIKTKRPGDTGVGFTLETLLGIEANSSKEPDFNGIELKAGRYGSQKTGQVAILSQVPNWEISNLKGSKEILKKHGRYSAEKQRNQIFHEISALRPNSYNMQLELNEDYSLLNQIFWASLTSKKKEYDVTWEMTKLLQRLNQKHKETFWVTAESKGTGENEEFYYKTVKHTYGLDELAFPFLVESGQMTIHYLIKELKTGAAKDQGYLFKMSPKFIPSLFKYSNMYSF